ncbi:MAG TPA: PRC and DUF2382 domain-containing protein [Longimicrobium sp.]|nr:PRC and DUF2382 domain-containing protein [Longimicrobium sp.]
MLSGESGLVPIGETEGAGDADVRGWRVIAGDGTLLGAIADVLVDRDGGEARYLAVALEASVARTQGGRRVYVPLHAARMDRESRWVHLDGVTGESAPSLPAQPTDDLPAAPIASETRTLDADTGEARLTLSEEELQIGKRTVTTGEVRVEKHVETELVRETVPVMREDVTVERRPLPPGAGLEPRVEGDVIHVPIVEEEVVITKRLVAREELVITKRQIVEDEVIETELRRERAHVVGSAHDGEIISDPPA